MKLYLKNHTYKYAAEQMMLTLFPGEKPEYPEGEPAGEENSLVLSLSLGTTWATAHAVLLYEGKTFSRFSRAPLPSPEADRLERDRVFQRALKNAFYRAGTDALGKEPPWGALTGVRPVKIPTRDLERGLSQGEADRRLRDLYRVSAPRRRLALDCARASLAVKSALEPGDLSLYVGIPFCPTRCAYCSFISADAGKSLRLMEPYLEALLREVEAAGGALRRAGRQVKSLYFGGGTPTTLTSAQLDRLMEAVERHIDLSGCTEYTVEAGRPDTITPEKLAVLKAHGCGRISVNPQTMEDHVLRAIGRAHTAGDILTAWDLVEKAGFPYVNMDLIAGLPDDSIEGFRRSLDTVLALGPQNITVHTLALKKGSRLMSGPAVLPGPQEVAAMLEYAWQTLRDRGYVPYYLYRQKYMSGGFENVGWCRPGGESIYNICMMEELHSILALGAGGVSKFIDSGSGSLKRISNPKYPKEYMEKIDHIICQKEEIPCPIS